MALPNTFAAQTSPQMVELDQNFAALGALTTIPSTATGTNTLALTVAANTPTVAAYANYQAFSFIAANTNTTATTAAVGSLAALNVYVDTSTGPVLTTGGEIRAGNLAVLTYDSALNTGAGGFHLTSVLPQPRPNISITNSVTIASGTTLTAAQLTGSGNGFAVILRTGGGGSGFNDQTDTAAAIVSAIPSVVVNARFQFRYINTTGQTGTITAGSGVTVNATNTTTANGATHDYVGVITNVGTPAVSIYG